MSFSLFRCLPFQFQVMELSHLVQRLTVFFLLLRLRFSLAMGKCKFYGVKWLFLGFIFYRAAHCCQKVWVGAPASIQPVGERAKRKRRKVLVLYRVNILCAAFFLLAAPLCDIRIQFFQQFNDNDGGLF